jgi:hypothetical protein
MGPVASRYTDWAIPAPVQAVGFYNSMGDSHFEYLPKHRIFWEAFSSFPRPLQSYKDDAEFRFPAYRFLFIVDYLSQNSLA